MCSKEERRKKKKEKRKKKGRGGGRRRSNYDFLATYFTDGQNLLIIIDGCISMDIYQQICSC